MIHRCRSKRLVNYINKLTSSGDPSWKKDLILRIVRHYLIISRPELRKIIVDELNAMSNHVFDQKIVELVVEEAIDFADIGHHLVYSIPEMKYFVFLYKGRECYLKPLFQNSADLGRWYRTLPQATQIEIAIQWACSYKYARAAFKVMISKIPIYGKEFGAEVDTFFAEYSNLCLNVIGSNKSAHMIAIGVIANLSNDQIRALVSLHIGPCDNFENNLIMARYLDVSFQQEIARWIIQCKEKKESA